MTGQYHACEGLSRGEKQELEGVTVQQLITQWRAATRIRKAAASTSDYIGVSWDQRDEKWASQIMRGRVRKHLGSYAREPDAARAYDKAAFESDGRWADIDGVL